MKNLLIMSFTLVALIACSSEQPPTPDKIRQNLQSVPEDKVVAVIAEKNYPAPRSGQIIDENVVSKTVDNIYTEDGEKLIVPQGSVITGNYINDGTSCVIVWKAVYANKSEYKKKNGTFSLSDIAQPSRCDPVKGLKVGNRIFIKFSTWSNWFPQ